MCRAAHDSRAGERALSLVALPQRHQPRHLLLGEADFLAAEFRQRQVLDLERCAAGFCGLVECVNVCNCCWHCYVPLSGFYNESLPSSLVVVTVASAFLTARGAPPALSLAAPLPRRCPPAARSGRRRSSSFNQEPAASSQEPAASRLFFHSRRNEQRRALRRGGHRERENSNPVEPGTAQQTCESAPR